MIVPTISELQAFNEGKPFFGKFLREARIEKKISLIAAAQSCGIEPFLWSDFEHGRKYVSRSDLEKIAKALDTSATTLRLAQERLDHEQEAWLQKHPKIVQWLKDVANKER